MKVEDSASVFTDAATQLLALDAHKSNSADLPANVRGIYVGTTGDLRVLGAADDVPVTFKNIPAGTTIVACVRRLLSTGTTASNLVGMI